MLFAAVLLASGIVFIKAQTSVPEQIGAAIRVQPICRPPCPPGEKCINVLPFCPAGPGSTFVCRPFPTCVSICTGNEVWSQCPLCQPTCYTELERDEACPFICPKQGGCICKTGYIREYAGGDCINKDDCPWYLQGNSVSNS